MADKGKDTARASIQSDDCAASITQGCQCCNLQAAIQVQCNVLSSDGWILIQLMTDSTVGVDLYALVSHLAVQRTLVDTFNAAPTDTLCSAVAHTIQALQIFFTHSSYRADRMCQQATERIVP